MSIFIFIHMTSLSLLFSDARRKRSANKRRSSLSANVAVLLADTVITYFVCKQLRTPMVTFRQVSIPP